MSPVQPRGRLVPCTLAVLAGLVHTAAADPGAPPSDVPAAVAPAPDAQGRVRLDLDGALALLRRQSPDVLAARLRARAAHGDVVTARLFPNPVFSTEIGNFAIGHTGYRQSLSARDTVVSQFGLSEEIPMWGKRGARIAAATGRAAQADAERQDLDRQLAFQVRAQFTALLAADERLRLAREAAARYQETVRVSQARAKNGEIAPAELERIELEQRSFEREVADAELDRRDAVAGLLPLVGVDAADVEPVGTLAVPEAPEDVDALAREALERRPDLRAATFAAAAAEGALRQARAEAWPNPTVGVSYTHSEFTVSGDLPNAIGGTLSVPLPVVDRNQGAIERAQAEALAARHDVDKLRLAIPQEVRSAVVGYTTARGRVRRYADAFLRQARDTRAAAETSYREGATSLLELLEAERAFLQTQRDHMDALRDAATAAWDITRAAALEVSP
jgi:cobalt-zinc-cadmium efflux system outer membrane protein